MTMSGKNPEPSAPLDLSNGPREKRRCHAWDRTGQEHAANSRPTPAPAPAPASSCSRTLPLQTGTGGAGGQPRESAFRASPPPPDRSRLPFRKRPVPPDHQPAEPGVGVERRESRTQASRTAHSPLTFPNNNNNEFYWNGPRRALSPRPRSGAEHGGRDAPTHEHPAHYYVPAFAAPCTQVFQDVDCLLNEVALATRQDEDGDTALHIAVVQEKEAVVHKLIHILVQARRDVDLYNNLRQTPLHLAVITRQPAMVDSLLWAGADPGALDRNGQTALHLCCEHNQDRCLSVVLSNLSRLNSPSAFLDIRNYEGFTPLHLAVQKGDVKLAKMLLEGGADINAVDNKSGRSALVHAVENSCIEMVNFLIESGCNVNSQSYSGNTALHIACGRGELEALRLLLKNGADSSLKNYHNETAIMVAKNKKVSDVLRGKSTRCQSLKALSSNDSPSPSGSSRSPLATPTPHQPDFISPEDLPAHSPHSQSGESASGNQSPRETLEAQDVPMRVRTFRSAAAESRADCNVAAHNYHLASTPPFESLIPAVPHLPHLAYYPLYATDTQYVLLRPALASRMSLGPISQSSVIQSRPASHNSDQSDLSNTSSEGKGIS